MIWVCHVHRVDVSFNNLNFRQGIVNTFTEHWGGVWSVKDMQHTYVMSPYVLISDLTHGSACWESFGGQVVHWAYSFLVTTRCAVLVCP